MPGGGSVTRPCWLVFDEEYLRRYGFFGRDGRDWLTTADSLDELAAAIEVPGDALATTVARFNAHAVDGDDPDFHRGRSAYDSWNGDQHHRPGPAATLGPLTEPPFHAIRIHSGALGTKGGPRTDKDGRVLDVDGAAIPGLYAAGNAMAAATGMVYGGAAASRGWSSGTARGGTLREPPRDPGAHPRRAAGAHRRPRRPSAGGGADSGR